MCIRDRSLITMPKLSPTMERGVIVKWHKKEGDPIEEGDVLFEVATDKSTVEYQAIDKGFLRQIIVKEGKEAALNDPVAIFTKTKDESFDAFSKTPLSNSEQESKEEKSQTQSEQDASEIKDTPPREPVETPTSIKATGFAPEPPLTHYQFNWKGDSSVLASPLAKKLAREKNIDLTSIKGSGPGGRICLLYTSPSPRD